MCLCGISDASNFDVFVYSADLAFLRAAQACRIACTELRSSFSERERAFSSRLRLFQRVSGSSGDKCNYPHARAGDEAAAAVTVVVVVVQATYWR